MAIDTCGHLIEVNTGWLRQALHLVEELDDTTYSRCPQDLAPHRVGGHLRHVLEFYECFFQGLACRRIDYDARTRDQSIERSRSAAAERIRSLIHAMEETPAVRRDASIQVRLEGSDCGTECSSSISRELQALSSHTIHHFALISVTLRVHGFRVHPDFGMSPSTLRFHASRWPASSEAA